MSGDFLAFKLQHLLLFFAILLVMLVSSSASSEKAKDQWMFQSEEKWDSQWRAGQWAYMDTVAIERAKVSVVGVLAQIYASNMTSDVAAGQGSVLDIGCGEGSLADFLSAEQQPGYVGVDLSREAILSAKRKRPSMKFVHSSAFKFRPKGSKTFRVISFADMLYYVDHKSVLEQYNSYLSPGGIVIISMFFQETGKLLYENIWKDARETFQKIDEMELSGSTKKQAHGKAVVEAATAFHIEVYRKREGGGTGVAAAFAGR